MEFLKKLGLSGEEIAVSDGHEFWVGHTKDILEVFSPVDGKKISNIMMAGQTDYEKLMGQAQQAFVQWRNVPAPKRGEVVRQIGNALRESKHELGQLVSYEMGKSLQEGMGEVQEMIDICDFAVGLARQLYGLSMHSERPKHRMYEQWHPLGVVGIISAFNFPVAVWAWNSVIAMVCGNVSLWKPSLKTPLSAIACFRVIEKILKSNGVPKGVLNMIIGSDAAIGEKMTQDERIPLISATGSTRMGKIVGAKVAARLGRTILELGGNNAIILTEHADLKRCLPAIVFGAVGTAGQRCTSTRRLIIHESIFDKVKEIICSAYKNLKVGDPLDEKNHVGPLIDRDAVENMMVALKKLKEQKGKVIWGGEVLSGKGYESGCYVTPALAEASNELSIVQEETFAPILYLIKYGGKVQQAIAIQNGVRQGLSSAIFTDNLLEAEAFLSANGSDCGIANVNIGTSGAEIGGAFGGEKETGGGRESGSDAWKAYMRRQTNTINYGEELPLAQGIKFEI